MTPENEAKVNYLRRYKWDLIALEEIESEITACRLGALPGAISYTGMPHGGGDNKADLANYAARIDELLMKFKRKREETIQDLHEIADAIDDMTRRDPNDAALSALLRYKYIQNKKWEEIGILMGYSEIHVKSTLYGKALMKFKIPTKSYGVFCYDGSVEV